MTKIPVLISVRAFGANTFAAVADLHPLGGSVAFLLLMFGRLPMLPPHFFDDNTPDYRDIVDLLSFLFCTELIVFCHGDG